MALSPEVHFVADPVLGSRSNGGGFRGSSLTSLSTSAPDSPVVVESDDGVGTVAGGDYYTVLCYENENGSSPGSQETHISTSGGLSLIVGSPDPSPNASTFGVYMGTLPGGPYFLHSTGNSIGAAVVISLTPPTSGTQALGYNYASQGFPQVVIDNSTVTGSTLGANSNILILVGYQVSGLDVGNLLNLPRTNNGTNFNYGVFQIVAIDPVVNSWTLEGNRNLTTGGGAGSGLKGIMGGALDLIREQTIPIIISDILPVAKVATVGDEYMLNDKRLSVECVEVDS